jgi:hypothetical protein
MPSFGRRVRPEKRFTNNLENFKPGSSEPAVDETKSGPEPNDLSHEIKKLWFLVEIWCGFRLAMTAQAACSAFFLHNLPNQNGAGDFFFRLPTLPSASLLPFKPR